MWRCTIWAKVCGPDYSIHMCFLNIPTCYFNLHTLIPRRLSILVLGSNCLDLCGTRALMCWGTDGEWGSLGQGRSSRSSLSCSVVEDPWVLLLYAQQSRPSWSSFCTQGNSIHLCLTILRQHSGEAPNMVVMIRQPQPFGHNVYICK